MDSKLHVRISDNTNFDDFNDAVESEFDPGTVVLFKTDDDPDVTVWGNALVGAAGPVAAVLDRVKQLRELGGYVLDIEPDLVTLDDIVTRSEVSRTDVEAWVRAVSPKFPRAVATLQHECRVWDWGEIERWVALNHSWMLEHHMDGCVYTYLTRAEQSKVRLHIYGMTGWSPV